MSVAKYFSRRLRPALLSGQEPGWLKVHPRRSYIVAVISASVPWGDEIDLRLLSAWARALTVFWGVEHVCDHRIPITHPYVCGLNIPENIQILTRKANSAKGNKWAPDQLLLGLDCEV